MVAAGAVILLILLGAVVVSGAYAIKAKDSARNEQQQRRREENETREAQGQRRIAQRETVRAQEQERVADFQSYAATLRAAQAAIQANDVGIARAFLESVEENKRAREWRHLYGRLDQSIQTLVEVDDITALRFAINASGTRLAAAVQKPDGNVLTLHDLTGMSSLPIQRQESKEGTFSVALSSDGSLLAQCFLLRDEEGINAEIRVRRAASRLNSPWLARWPVPEPAASLAFRPGTLWLASGSWSSIDLWDLSEMPSLSNSGDAPGIVIGGAPRLLARMEGHDRNVLGFAFSPDGALLASGSDDNTIRLWDMERAADGGKDCEVAVLIGHTDHVDGVAFSPDGRFLASASVDETIRIWDVQDSLRRADEDRRHGNPGASSGTRIGVLTGHTQSVLSVAYDSTGTRLVSGGYDRTIRIWDVNERALVSGYGNHRNWPIRRRRLLETLRGHTASINQVAFLPDGRIVSASADESCKLWAPGTDDVLGLPEHYTSLSDVAFSPDGRFVISAGPSGDSSFIVWDVEQGKLFARHYVNDSIGPEGLACFQNAGGSFLAIALGDPFDQVEGGRVELWTFEDWTKPFRVLTDGGRAQSYTSVATSDNGMRLAAGTAGGTAFVWDISDLNEPRVIQTLEGHKDRINSVLFLDEQGRWLASASGVWRGGQSTDSTIRVGDIELGGEVDRQSDHKQMITDLSLSPNRRTLASASTDTTVRLWSVNGLEAGLPHLTSNGVLDGLPDFSGPNISEMRIGTRGHGRPWQSYQRVA